MASVKVKLPPIGKPLGLRKVKDGLWVVTDAYTRKYDYFESSKVFSSPEPHVESTDVDQGISDLYQARIKVDSTE